MTGGQNVKLTDLLTPIMMIEIQNAHARGSLTLAWLKDFLGHHRAPLEAKGVLPEYLAYAIANAIHLTR